MRVWKILAGLAAAVALPVAAQVPAPRAPGVAVSGPASPVAAAPLTKADVDAWLDGFVPYAIDQADIAGAVVVVVKDGKVLTERGFGYANVAKRTPVDPATTMFRPGSTSKLFTWTAVMQLVQAGKIDLDADVNTYLDFKIPPAFGKPITMRDLMTHTPGFEESAKYLIVFAPNQPLPLDQILKRWVPRRIYAPGTMPSYSNYGCALAGYIVQRVSGERFDAYIQHHIFDVLGMTHATFVQPLPARFAANMATGYLQASVKPDGYEMISLAPAGSLAASGGDMAKFMIAQLQQGGPLLSPKTAALMHAPANTPIPGMPSMALGFYHEDRGGLDIIGHAGDLNFFHSDLHLYLDQGVGLFMSFNSAGKGGAAHVVRERLFDEFTDRYFAQVQPNLPTQPTAHAHGLLLSGHYVSSRASRSNFLKAINLIGGTSLVLNPDDSITVGALTNAAGVPKRWREVAPWQWQEVGGSDRLGALVRDGRVVMFAPAAFAPIIEFLPAPATLNAGWIYPVAGIAFAVLLITALSWPIVALVRRSYRYDPGIAGRGLLLHRASRVTAWALLVVYGGWLALVSVMTADASAFDGRLDIWIRLLQVVLIGGIVGTVLTLWNVAAVAGRPGRKLWALAWSILLAAAAVFLVWLALDVNLLTVDLNY
jgi:CubicO group peptidase (beta-lactamase class C family)